MHLGRATQKAIRLAMNKHRDMAVVHSGCGEYTVKNLELALDHYPLCVRRTVCPSGNWWENNEFDRTR